MLTEAVMRVVDMAEMLETVSPGSSLETLEVELNAVKAAVNDTDKDVLCSAEFGDTFSA
jgi:hypothetical protein